jgi:hypothetical protein
VKMGLSVAMKRKDCPPREVQIAVAAALRCAESLWVPPRCVRRNGVRIAALEGLEDSDTRLSSPQIRRFHSTKEMTPATINRVAAPPIMAFFITLICDDFEGTFVSVVLKLMLMLCTGILCYTNISQAQMTSLKRTLEPKVQTLRLVQD